MNPQGKFVAPAIAVLFSVLCTLALAAGVRLGLASYYSETYEGKPTASGQPYHRQDFTAASYEYYKQTVEVRNEANGRAVVVFVNDRGPNPRLGRILDLSEAAFAEIATGEDIRRGTALVRIRQYP